MATEVADVEFKIGDEVQIVGKLAALFRDESGVIEQLEAESGDKVVKYFVRFGHHRIPFLRSHLRKSHT
jgi:hypothetical protein